MWRRNPILKPRFGLLESRGVGRFKRVDNRRFLRVWVHATQVGMSGEAVAPYMAGLVLAEFNNPFGSGGTTDQLAVQVREFGTAVVVESDAVREVHPEEDEEWQADWDTV